MYKAVAHRWPGEIVETSKPGGRLSKSEFFGKIKCSDWKFAAEKCLKNNIKTCKTRKTLSNCDKYIKLVPVYSVSR